MDRSRKQMIAALLGALRDADWLDAKRARAYLVILALVTAASVAVYLALSRHGLDPSGKPLGTDFASFWTASELALAGRPAQAWDEPAHRAAQAALFGEAAGYAAFYYPPPYLLACLPLALLPYGWALLAWLATTGAAWFAMMRAWLCAVQDAPLGPLALLAFPAVTVTAGHGQNAFLTATLLGAGGLLHARQPWLAGALFGTLIIKPHLAVLVPLFLIFTGNWRSFIAAGACAAALSLLSLAAFGWPAWQAFFDASAAARAVLDHETVGFAKMQSAFAAVRLLGGSATLAWAMQGAAFACAVVAMWRVRHAGSDLAKGAALSCATLLATPFLLDYDLTLLGVPLVWLFAQGHRDGFHAWEKAVLAAGFLLPLIARPLATAAHVPLAPFAILALLALLVRRATGASASAAHGRIVANGSGSR